MTSNQFSFYQEKKTKERNTVIKAIYSFYANKGFKSNKDRDIELLDNSQTMI